MNIEISYMGDMAYAKCETKKYVGLHLMYLNSNNKMLFDNSTHFAKMPELRLTKKQNQRILSRMFGV
jgi:hypothetical protein